MYYNIEEAKEYEKLKIKLMEENKINHKNYHKNKEPFIKEKIIKANEWKNNLVKMEKPAHNRTVYAAPPVGGLASVKHQSG